jgi:hypothetical protein
MRTASPARSASCSSKVRKVSTSNGGNRRWKHQEQRIAGALGTSLIADNGARRSDMEWGWAKS